MKAIVAAILILIGLFAIAYKHNDPPGIALVVPCEQPEQRQGNVTLCK